MQTHPVQTGHRQHYAEERTALHGKLYPLPLENEFCCSPAACRNVEVLFLGSGIGLSTVPYLQERALQTLGRFLRVPPLPMLGFSISTPTWHIPAIRAEQ